jgi:hypothetical protein
VLLASTAGSPGGNLIVLGQYAYIQSGYVGPAIVDLSDIAMPSIVATAPASSATGYGYSSIAFSGRYMFSANRFAFQTTRLW